MDSPQYQIEIDEIVRAHTTRMGELQHELLMQKIVTEKVQNRLREVTEELNEYKAAEAERIRESAAARVSG